MTENDVGTKLAELADRLNRLRQQLSEVLRTEQLEIVDRHGVKRAICTGRAGFASFGLNAANEFIRADLMVRGDGMPRLIFLGEARAEVDLAIQTEFCEGAPFLTLGHARCRARICVGEEINTDASGVFISSRNTENAQLAIDMKGRAALSLGCAQGRKVGVKP